MKALVTFAVEAEFARWRTERRFFSAGSAGALAYEARLGADELTVVFTGTGLRRAGSVACATLTDRPDICISSGFVGGLKPAQRVGELLVARTVRMAGRAAATTDPDLVELAVRCGATPVKAFWTSETLVRGAQEKLQLSAVADGVEMESYAVLAAAAERGVPAVAIRAVSDTAEIDLPYAFDEAVDPRGQISLNRLLIHLARRPQRLPALARVARQCHRASGSLAEFLDRYLEAWQCTRPTSAPAWEVVCT